jgi:hypothetical protein
VKKIFTSILSLLILTACSGSAGQVTWSKTSFYQVVIGGADFYFLHPEEASLNEISDGVKIFYDGCKVFAGDYSDLFGSKQLIDENKIKEDLEYTAWYREDVLVAYDIRVISKNYLFRVGDGSESIVNCTQLVDAIGESFTSELGYINEKYDFSLVLPSDFDVEYFADDTGLVLRKWVKVELTAEDIEEGKEPQYKVEIVVMPTENSEGYDDISSFIGSEYPGFSIEFKDAGEFSGFFVDEGSGGDAIRHFFALSDDKSVIHELYLKLPSPNYNEHKASFDELINQMKIF